MEDTPRCIMKQVLIVCSLAVVLGLGTSNAVGQIIELGADTLDFGEVFIRDTSHQRLVVRNPGTLDLIISAATVDNPPFGVYPAFAGVQAGESDSFAVTFMPTADQIYAGILTLLSNAINNDSCAVALLGRGVWPPVISVTPDSAGEHLLSGKSHGQIVSIYNAGGSDLTFSINMRERWEASSLLLDVPSRDDHPTRDSGQDPRSTRLHFSDDQTYSRSSVPLREPHTAINDGSYRAERRLSGLKVLLVTSADSPPDEIRNALLSFGDIQIVDVFDASGATPSLDELIPYHTVIVMNNSHFSDPVTMGNVLADFVDAGKGLIVTIATFCSGWEVQGRFLDQHYSPFNVGNGPVGSASLGTFNQNHPIMRGVSNAGGDLLAAVTPADSADLVASWNNGLPLVATKGRNVAALNFFVPVSGYWTGDIPLMLHNAVYWAGGCGWLSASPERGTVPAGSSIDITVTFDAAGLRGGEYDANIIVSSNDPVRSELALPAHLQVTDAPAFHANTNAIEFGEVFLGVTDTVRLEVENIGSQDLLVFSATSQPASYTVRPAFAGIDPGESELFTVTFLPQIVGNYPGTLTFLSNDPVYGKYVVNLSGQGVEPPIIVVSPDSLVVGLLPGATSTRILTINNEGPSNLYFEIVGGSSPSNYALQFDGQLGSYVVCGNNASLNIRHSITMEAWIYALDWDGNRRIFQKGGYDDQYRFLAENGFFVVDLAAITGGRLECPLPSATSWHHIAGVYDYELQSITIYEDGSPIATHAASGEIALSSDNLIIGAKSLGNDVAGDYWKGMLDEIRIWNIARSENDIREDMNRELSGTEPGLAAYWPFNEGTGNTAFDKTANANHGSLQRGVVWTDSSAPIAPGWFEMNVDSGICPPNSSTDIQIVFDATALDTGDYDAALRIVNNDPVHSSVIVPVHLVVSTTVGVQAGLDIPLVFRLRQNYPNPFNPSTTIRYELPNTTHVTLTVYDLLGQEVATLVNGMEEPGFKSVRFDAKGLASGMYFYRLQAGTFVATRKLLLLR